MSVEDVLAEVLKDLPFYQTSGGGMTLSGGEPTLQIDFIAALLQQAHLKGLHCCVETSAYTDPQRLERIKPFVNLWLIDWKESDPQRHRSYCGVDHARILENIRALHNSGAKIRLRCPIIPGFNDRPDHFDGIAKIFRELPNLEGVEIMPYHRLGEGKLERFGHPAKSLNVEMPTPSQVQGYKHELRVRNVTIVNE